MHDNKPNNFYIKHFFINCQIKKLQPIFDTFVPPCILVPALTKGLERIFRSLDLNVSYTAGPSLQSLLGNPKDKVNRNEKSGIYEIDCKDCNQKYIGQTKRPIITRFKERMAHP
jgi:hypothetical protein